MNQPGHRPLLLPILIGLCAAALAACHARPPGAATSTAAPLDSVGVAVSEIRSQQSANEYVKLAYPVVTGDAAARLNPVIQKWIGDRCPVPAPEARHYDGATACAAAFAAACTRLGREYADRTATFGCTLDATTAIKLDAAGLLGVTYTTYAYTGGAHGNTVVSQLNLDLDDGHVLGLKDLLGHVDEHRLSAAIAAAVRTARHIPATQSLKQAGFFVDPLPIPDTVLALPQGLEFTYQSYEVGPYVFGQPQGIVPWAALSGMLRDTPLLARLRKLGRQLTAGG